MSSRADLDRIYQSETRLVQFNFTSDLAVGETISTKAVTSAVYTGTDASPSAVISGSATSSGAIVTQKIIGQTLGVIYELLCEITTSLGQTIRKVGLLAVVPREP